MPDQFMDFTIYIQYDTTTMRNQRLKHDSLHILCIDTTIIYYMHPSAEVVEFIATMATKAADVARSDMEVSAIPWGRWVPATVHCDR